MSGNINPVSNAPNPGQFFIREKFYPAHKTISYIPWVGIIPSFFQEKSLCRELETLKKSNKPQMIQWLTAMNKHKVTTITRNLASTVLLIVGIARGIIPYALLGSACAFLHLVSIGVDLFNLDQNIKALKSVHHNSYHVQVAGNRLAYTWVAVES